MKTLVLLCTKRLDPPEDGRAVTLRNLLHLLLEAGRWRVLLASFRSQSCAIARLVESLPIEPRLSLRRLLGTLADDARPIQTALYDPEAIALQIRRRIGEEPVDVVVADMVRTCEVALALDARRRILDMDDLLSVRYAQQARVSVHARPFGKASELLPRPLVALAGLFAKQVLAAESRRMELYERAIVKRFDQVVLVSQAEARQLSLVTGARNVVAIPNFFSEEPATGPNEATPASRTSDSELLFFGSLSTAHNVDAARFLALEVFPLVRRVIPEAHLTIVGRRPHGSVLSLRGRDGIDVESDVGEIRPYLDRADVCVMPIRFGSGVQTKALEAFAAGVPVVASSAVAAGIPDSQSALLVADSPAEIVSHVLALLADRDLAGRMAAGGRDVLRRHFGLDLVRERWLATIEG